MKNQFFTGCLNGCKKKKEVGKQIPFDQMDDAFFQNEAKKRKEKQRKFKPLGKD